MIYLVSGLNFGNFLSKVKEQNITLTHLEKLSQNEYKIGTNQKHNKNLLKLFEHFGFKYKEFLAPKTLSFLRLVKSNFVFFLCALIICVGGVFSSNFVFKTKIYGLKNVKESQVLQVLNEQGYKMGKLKSSYNLENLEQVLINNIPKISFASAIIKGGTLVVNIHEKIDNSSQIYDYSPIVAPCNCILQSVELISGTQLKHALDAVREGEEIVAPQVQYLDGTTISVPAKAKITASVNFSHSFFVKSGADEHTLQILLEENKKKLYNKLSNLNVTNKVTENISTTKTDGGMVYQINLSATVSI